MYNSYCNLIARLKIALKTNLKIVHIKYNKFVINILYILYKNGLIENFKILKKEKNINKQCRIYLKYKFNRNVIRDIILYSKPSNHTFIKQKKLLFNYLSKDKNSLFFISTYKGLRVYNYYNLKYLNYKTGGILLFKISRC